MTMANAAHFTRCGLPGIELVPFGTHACHFYRDRDELIAALVPYFIAGLEQNERCLWVTAPPLPAREAIQALRAAWPRADDAISSGALRILDFDRWYTNAAGLTGLDVVEVWLKEEERALAEGHTGLRITGNVTFLKPDEWPAFMEYERAVTARISSRRIVALCSYELAQCSDAQRHETMLAHRCGFERPDDDWQVVALPKIESVRSASKSETSSSSTGLSALTALDQAAWDAFPDAIYMCDADGRVIRFNRKAAELWGREPDLKDPQERFCGSFRLHRMDGAALPHEQCPMAAAVQHGLSFENEEVVVEQPNGKRLTVLVNIAPLKDADGRVCGAINCFRDISERKQLEDRQRFLLDELNHRIKNTLATVHSLAASTARSAASLEEFSSEFEARLTALDHAHSLLRKDESSTAQLRSLLAAQVQAFSAGREDRIRFEGPEVDLPPRLAFALSMAFHELLTNASKYGSLSGERGKIAIEWDVSSHANGDRSLALNWTESDGPAVKAPRRRGFGTRLIERTIQDELNGEANLRFDSSGLRLSANIPLPAEIQ